MKQEIQTGSVLGLESQLDSIEAVNPSVKNRLPVTSVHRKAWDVSELISKKYECLVWQDELKVPFLLLKYAEVFEYSDTTLGLHCWNKKVLAVLRFEGLISFEMTTDDPLVILRVDKCHLPRLLALGSFRKRPDINGAWIKEKKKLLAHKILTYRPKLEREE